jgi:hypothetical protein
MQIDFTALHQAAYFSPLKSQTDLVVLLIFISMVESHNFVTGVEAKIANRCKMLGAVTKEKWGR